MIVSDLKDRLLRLPGAIERVFLILYPFLLPIALIALAFSAFMVQDWSALIHQWGHFLLLAGLMLGVWLEVWRKRIDENEARRLHEERARREMALLESKLNLESSAQQRRAEFVQTEVTSLNTVAECVGDIIARRLVSKPDWATRALLEAKIHVGPRSLFTIRSEHFRDEKRHIAERFVPLLIRRFEYHADKDRIILLVDAGTTVHPIMEKLGRLAVNARKEQRPWVEKLELWTNNLPGVLTLSEIGRIDSDNPYSKLAFSTNLLPGVPIPAFAAVTGEITEKALSELKLSMKGLNTVFISLVTGNWIRIRRSEPCCPIPLARGRGHLDFKQALFNHADEVYVIAPLGKVFADNQREKIMEAVNGSLKLHKGGAYETYDEVAVNTAPGGGNVKLISTARYADERVLFDHSQIVADRVMAVGDRTANSAAFDQFDTMQIEQLKSVMFDFDDLPNDRIAEKHIELPHPYTRNPEFMGTFFRVRDQ